MSAFPQYQGGSSVSVFTAQGSNPAVNCKISGKSVHKVYDRSVKGYVYSCAGGMLSKIQFPKDEKTGLQLIQPYLVLQIFVPIGQHFSLELRVTDTQNTRRKMYLSTSFSELKSNPLHCQIPLSMNDWSPFARASDKLEANEQRVFNDPERSCLSTQKLGENGTQNCSNPPGGNMEDIARPSDKVLNSNKLQEAGGVLQHNGPFGSTEELWIVHDEGDFSDPSAFSFSDKTDKDTSQLAGSSITKSGIVQLSTRQFGAVTTGKPNFIVDTTGDSSSFPVSISASKEPTLNKLVQNSTLANMTDNLAKPTNFDMRKPLTSKLEDKELDLLYDPILDCYYDPKTNRYYELK